MISNADYLQILARLNRGKSTGPNEGVDDEAKLHADIIEFCRSKGWICFRGSMAHRTYRVPGEPDFAILADGGKVHFVEAKTKGGKLSTEQLGIKAWAEKLGHKVHVVRSLEQFVAATRV